MSSDTHGGPYSRYSHKEFSSQVSKRFEKYFLSYHMDKLGPQGRMDRHRQHQYLSSLRAKGDEMLKVTYLDIVSS